MATNFLFANPVLAQGQQAQAQNALNARAQDLQNLQMLMQAVQQGQRTASEERQNQARVGAQRYQTDAYRESAADQNAIGRTRANTEQGRLTLDQIIAANDREWRQQELATRESIAKINANATRLRPQDIVDLEERAFRHNEMADEQNAQASNAVMALQSIIADAKKADAEKLTTEKDGFFTRRSTAKAEADKEIGDRPITEYLGRIFATNPEYLGLVTLEGGALKPKLVSKVGVENGRLTAIMPSMTSRTATTPTASPVQQILQASRTNALPTYRGYRVQPVQ